jgi:ATP-dependent DNA helicase RecG
MTDDREEALNRVLERGEDSLHQFKQDVTNEDALAAEFVAFANSGGGTIYLGVSDHGCVTGLDRMNVRRLNLMISNAASQHVKPPLHPKTEVIQTSRGLVLRVDLPTGLNKPYMDLQGRVWIKNGADKRHVTAREELQRMFQRSGLLHADVVPVQGTSVLDIDHRALY